MTIEERIERLEGRIEEIGRLKRALARDIYALKTLHAGEWTPPNPGDECAYWRVGDEYQLIHAPTGAEFTVHDAKRAQCVLYHIRESDVHFFVYNWYRAVNAGHHLALEGK